MELSASPAENLRELWLSLVQGPVHPGGLCPSPAPRGPDEPTLARAQGWQDSSKTPADLKISQPRPACAFNHVLLKSWGGQEGVPAQGTLKALIRLAGSGHTSSAPRLSLSASLACCPGEDLPLSFLSAVQQPPPFPV